jgi:hypothetical protein
MRRALLLPPRNAASLLDPRLPLGFLDLVHRLQLDVAGSIGLAEGDGGSKSAPPKNTTFTETSYETISDIHPTSGRP